MTILIVDDEPMMLRYLDTMLRGAGYEVFMADGGDEALVICSSAGCCFDLRGSLWITFEEGTVPNPAVRSQQFAGLVLTGVACHG